MAAFQYQALFEHHADTTPYRRLTSDYVSTATFGEQEILQVAPEALTLIAREAMDDVAHLLRSSHLKQLAAILDDPEASDNDRFVALELLKNANIAASRVLPGCQDTGTAIAIGYKGENVFTFANDAEALSRGIYQAYDERNLRYSQMAPLDMYREKNTGTNLPAQIELYAEPGGEYRFLFIAKGGGSANKTFLYQETKALLNPASLLKFIAEKIRSLGTSACPPYHLALVIGGLSAELTLKTVQAGQHTLPGRPADLGQPPGARLPGPRAGAADLRTVRADRHRRAVWRQVFCPRRAGHPAAAPRRLVPGRPRRVRAPRTGRSSARSPAKASSGAARNQPGAVLPEVTEDDLSSEVVAVDLNQPMPDSSPVCRQYPVGTRLALSGPMVVARDIAHARLKDRLDAGRRAAAVHQGSRHLLRRSPPRSPTATPPAPSVPPPPVVWTPTWTPSKASAAAW